MTSDGEVMLTSSYGAFEEFGRDMTRGGGRGVSCDGKRYTAIRKSKTHLFIWNAPSASELGDSRDVVFKVTAASGASGNFRQNAVTLVPDDSLERPPSDDGLESPPSEDALKTRNAGDRTTGAVAAVVVAAFVFVVAAAIAYRRRQTQMHVQYVDAVELSKQFE